MYKDRWIPIPIPDFYSGIRGQVLPIYRRRPRITGKRSNYILVKPAFQLGNEHSELSRDSLAAGSPQSPKVAVERVKDKVKATPKGMECGILRCVGGLYWVVCGLCGLS